MIEALVVIVVLFFICLPLYCRGMGDVPSHEEKRQQSDWLKKRLEAEQGR